MSPYNIGLTAAFGWLKSTWTVAAVCAGRNGAARAATRKIIAERFVMMSLLLPRLAHGLLDVKHLLQAARSESRRFRGACLSGTEYPGPRRKSTAPEPGCPLRMIALSGLGTFYP